MKSPAITPVAIRRFNGTAFTDTEDLLAIEEPLEIQVLYGPSDNRIKKNISVTMRTPGHDGELAAGFLFTEGIISRIADIEQVHQSPQHTNEVLVCLTQHTIPRLQNMERNFYATSSCGVCGKASIEAIHTLTTTGSGEQQGTVHIHTSFFRELQRILEQQQEIFGKTGGLHAAALFNREGTLVLVREDVGRHNALDKVIGAALQQQVPLYDHILLLSGRAGFELIQKAAMAGIRIIAAVGAPSSMAVQLAGERGITLVGFLRSDRFNVYSLTERITVE